MWFSVATRDNIENVIMTDHLYMPTDWQRTSPFSTTPSSSYTFMRVPATRDISCADGWVNKYEKELEGANI